MKSLSTEMECVKSAAILLNRDCVNKRYLDLFKKALWVSVGQRVVEVQAVKVGGKKNSADQPVGVEAGSKRVRIGPIGRISF